MAEVKILCYDCNHKRSIPGNCHIRCGARVSDRALQANPLLELGMLMSPRGFGWANFDPCYPRPITDCQDYEPHTASKQPA